MKKISFLCVFLVLVTLLAVGVSAQTKTYPDVPKSSWYHDAVMKASELGVVGGMPDGTFAPKASLTRAQYVTILQRLDGAADDVTSAFKDVTSKTWYAGAVGWAVKAGIVGGYEDNTFRGNKAISRQDLMVMTSRYLDYAWLGLGADPEAPRSFTDNAKIAAYARDAVNKMREIGLVKGDNAGAFNPKKTATRAEIATMIVRLTDSINAMDDAKTVGGTDITSFSVYSDILSEKGKADVAASFSKKIGTDIKVSSAPVSHSITFKVDESLKRLQYSVSEKDGNLCFSVSTPYAVEYFPQIVEDALSRRVHMSIPENSVSYGAYRLESVIGKDSSTIFFVCETDKNPLAYDVSDEVTFRVTLLSDGKLVSAPQFSYTYYNEYGKSKYASLDGISGQFILTSDGCTKPGVGRLSVTLTDKNGKEITGNYGADMEASVVFGFNDLNTVVEKPDDFREFWDAQLEKLMKVDPKAIKFEECPYESNSDYIVYDAEIETIGKPAVCHIAIPRNAEPGSLGITAHYYGTTPPFSTGAFRSSDQIFVTVNCHSISSHLTAEEYSQYDKEIDGWLFNDYDNGYENCYFYGMLMRDIQAIRFAEKQFADLWDGKTISIEGASMGAFQAVAVADIYGKVDKLKLDIPWMCDLGGSIRARRCAGQRPGYNDITKYLDTTYFAESFKGEVTITGGLGDYSCPPSGVVCLYNAFNCSKKSISFRQCDGHGDGFGKYCGTYSTSSWDPTFADADTVITDNGCAVSEVD